MRFTIRLKILYILAGIPTEGKSSVCLICMKYRITICRTAWIKYFHRILLTHHARTHACTDVRTCTPPHTTVAVRCFGAPNHDGVMVGRRCTEINRCTGHPISQRFWKLFAYKKMLGRTETWTRDRIYCQTMRTVRDISRDDRARIETCSLRTLTDLRPIIVLCRSTYEHRHNACVRVCACIWVCVHACMQTCMHDECVCVCVCVCMRAHVCVHFVCMHACVEFIFISTVQHHIVCTGIYTYVYTYT